MATCTDVIKYSATRSDGKNGPEYTVVFVAVFDGPADPGEASLASFGGVTIPQKFSFYPRKITEAETYANQIDIAAANNDHSKYRVTVKYTTEKPTDGDDPGGGGGGGENSDGDFVMPKTRIAYGTASKREPSDTDPRGKAVANSSGQYLAPPQDFETGLETITVTNYVKTFDRKKMEGKRKTVNEDQFMGYPAETLLLDDFTDNPQEFEKSDGTFEHYRQLVWTFIYDPDKWILEFADIGDMELEEPLDEPVPLPYSALEEQRVAAAKKTIHTKTGERQKVALDGKGKKAADGALPYIMKNYRFPASQFGQIGIDTNAPQ